VKACILCIAVVVVVIPEDRLAAAPTEKLTYIDRFGMTQRLPDSISRIVLAGSRPTPSLSDLLAGRPIVFIQPSCPTPGEIFLAGLRPATTLCVLEAGDADAPLDSCLAGCRRLVVFGGPLPKIELDQMPVARVSAVTWNRLRAFANESRSVCLSKGAVVPCP
jgi:hypothetical protein